jgi:hypothetical protein
MESGVQMVGIIQPGKTTPSKTDIALARRVDIVTSILLKRQ